MEKLSAERSRTYRADVNNGCQLQDVFDRRLGGIQFWGLEQGVVFGHDAWRCKYKEGFKDSELEKERKKERRIAEINRTAAVDDLPAADCPDREIAEAFRPVTYIALY